MLLGQSPKPYKTPKGGVGPLNLVFSHLLAFPIAALNGLFYNLLVASFMRTGLINPDHHLLQSLTGGLANQKYVKNHNLLFRTKPGNASALIHSPRRRCCN